MSRKSVPWESSCCVRMNRQAIGRTNRWQQGQTDTQTGKHDDANGQFCKLLKSTYRLFLYVSQCQSFNHFTCYQEKWYDCFSISGHPQRRNLESHKIKRKKGTEVARMLEAGSKLPTHIAGSENGNRPWKDTYFQFKKYSVKCKIAPRLCGNVLQLSV
jgi:hypothetical protein